MPVSVVSPLRRAGLAAALRAIVRATLAGEGMRPGEIAVVLSDDATLRRLNRRWRRMDRATDVLSFPYGEARGAIHGDLVISLERMAEQARRFRTGPGRELARLVVHGALHLAGHDHHREAERRLMRAREAAALRVAAPAVAVLERALREGPAAGRPHTARPKGSRPGPVPSAGPRRRV